MLKKQVRAAAASPRFERLREGAILQLKLGEALLPTVPRIDVDHDQSGGFTGHDANVRVRPAAPPLMDLFRVSACVLEAVRGQGILSARNTRENGPAAASVL